MRSSLLHFGSLLAIFSQLASSDPNLPTLLNTYETCVVSASGFEPVHDSLTINEAIARCGSGGTIIFPADQIYSIRSPINFSSCKGCDVQLEGQLWLSTEPALFANQTSFITFSGVNGATLRSLTGKGLINGQATALFQRPRENDPYAYLPPMVLIANSSNIQISNLHAKNVMKTFYRIDSKSTNISLSNLNVTVEKQWYDERWTRGESLGFHIRDSSHVSLKSINVDFRSNDPNAKVGVCAGIDWATDSIAIDDIYCNAGDGALIQFGSGGEYPNSIWNSSRGAWNLISPLPEQQFARNIRISNYIANSSDNSGFQNLLGYDNAMVRNFTYENVTVIGGKPILNDLCFVVSHGITAACDIYSHGIKANFTDVWFKGYKGKVGQPELGCFNENCTCDFHFEGWETQGVSKLHES